MLIAVLWYGFERTNIGAKIRAAVDNRRMAESVGINVDRLFTLTFAVGSGLAALGGGLAIQLFGLSPSFAVLYLVLFLIVVAVGGLGSLKGTLLAALVLGIFDTAGKYLFCRCRRLFHLRGDGQKIFPGGVEYAENQRRKQRPFRLPSPPTATTNRNSTR